MRINRLLVANRGEIAVRIIRAARELGIHTVVAHSQCDGNSLPVRLADDACEIGPPAAAKSYLDIEAIVQAAQAKNIDSVHPGYGFLAENAKFAQAVESAGMIFVGPDASTIELMGDKVNARTAAAAAGVPIVNGSAGRLESADEVCEAAEAIGYPILVKAAAGGGGRGIRIATHSSELPRLVPQAIAEAQATFGDGGVFIEQFIARARHIEVQVLGDGSDVIHCFERECSLQRRRQKIWEEAPAIVLPDAVRRQMCAAAVALAHHVQYRGAGTVEFLYDEAAGQFYFLEMNTRIQVEHPVTEFVTGIDLVREMLIIAGCGKLRLKQEDVGVRGHSIECRINAEDPARDFMPMPGKVESVMFPGGPGVRFDSMLYAGCEVPPFYDSMLGKLVVWDESRSRALRRLERALVELRIDGINTTQPLHQVLASDGDVREANFHTEYLEPWLLRNSFKLQ